MSQPTDTLTGRARRSRRPLPALIFFVVLALAAVFVWWHVLQGDAGQRSADAASCSTASAAPRSFDASKITVRVFNASTMTGKANEVATTLSSRGFAATAAGNAKLLDKGVGQLVFGPRGKEIARFLQLYVPGATLVQDTRADAVVDIVIGPDFKGLATQDDVAAKLAAAASASAAC